jgi:predicted flap endonuclease-1-like 5' DNA nuclease
MFRKFRLRYLLIGLLILLWWWIRRQQEGQSISAQTEPMEIEVPPETPSAPAAASRPASADKQQPDTTAPKAPEPELDDLRRIEGIGPKIAKLLREAGVESYTQLAAMSAEEIRDILTAGGVPVSKPDTWPEQANLAANGDWEGLEALQGELKGGRRA